MRAPGFLNFVLKAPDRVLSIHWSVLLTLVLCVLLCTGSAIGQTLPKSGPGAQPPSTDFVPPPPPEEEVIDDSNITYTSMPSTIEAGSTATVTVTAKNLGSTTWSSASPYPYRLGSALPADNQVWGVGRVNVQSYVPFGSTITFTLNIKAPSTPGTYTFAWQMLREDLHWFGQILSRTVTVTAPPPVYDAQITNATIPAQMSAGGTYNVSLTFKNTGNVTWTQPGYLIGTSSPYDNQIFGPNRVGLNVASVAPGQSATFNFQVKAPSATGNYAFDWGMLWEHNLRFGPTTRATVAVVAAVPLPTLSTAHSPSLVAGSTFTTSWSTTNATSLTRVCTAGGTGFKVNESLPVNGQRSQTALAAWVGYPSSCTWTAVGPSGTTVRTETMRTDPAPTSTPKPTISVARTPAPVEGQSFTTTWSTTNATALSRVCTASGAGYKVNESLAVTGSRTETAVVGWAANPSTCSWTASGAGGTTTYAETMTTTSNAGGNVTYIHTDGLGSPVARTNASKQVISRTRYEPYGYVAAGTQPTIGFTGHVNDVDTGLTYMQQRYYDPVAGRFLSIDPVTTDANTGGSFNRYAYANNSPYKYIDPDGRNAVTKFIKQTIKHRGDAIQAVADVASDVVTVVSPSSTMGERVEAAISLLSPVDVKDVKAAKNLLEKVSLPKPGKGPGSVPKEDRDPKRYFSPNEREAKRAEQNHECANGCGTEIDRGNSAGHHIERHADGGRTVSENHAEVCRDCHDKLHE
ncbi:RHS repeat-associated core domain-containing protein [Massilia sp. YIM B02443]|uniref:RHS repeat-associated core domain-containing protein n=1 Tax=Massilia sp. YIM B02443 TaxID=3050127 RepID=UPI0025B6DBE3|nr:RHS repeat-associated core domain-containing protein [Massilia sp. YIM B02443]MDN4037291.1 RHS repeat-associated core domain-containing protein [Massilia sp. YIM B02443]